MYSFWYIYQDEIGRLENRFEKGSKEAVPKMTGQAGGHIARDAAFPRGADLGIPDQLVVCAKVSRLCSWPLSAM